MLGNCEAYAIGKGSCTRLSAHRGTGSRLQLTSSWPSFACLTRSAVRDNVTGTGVAYPLFRRGVEKERFDRGVQLLSRDVEQLLMSRGVPVKRGGGQLLRNLERLMAVEGA